MSTILVTGANRGIGLEFIKQYVERGDNVIATYREEESSKELINLSKNKSNTNVKSS